MTIPSEKLKEHPYLIKCSISPGGFSCERTVEFQCYDSNGKLERNLIACHPMHVDGKKQLCRADMLKFEGTTALVWMNYKTCRVPIESLVYNSPEPTLQNP